MLQIFVGGLDPNVTDEHLKQVFNPYGELVYVKIPVGKRCGFVQFVNRFFLNINIIIIIIKLSGDSPKLTYSQLLFRKF